MTVIAQFRHVKMQLSQVFILTNKQSCKAGRVACRKEGMSFTTHPPHINFQAFVYDDLTACQVEQARYVFMLYVSKNNYHAWRNYGFSLRRDHSEKRCD